MFKWPKPPSPRAKVNELADWIELSCLKNESTSKTELSKLLGRLAENDNSEEDPEDNTERDPEDNSEKVPIDVRIEEACMEIERRQKICQDSYPFDWREQGTTLTLCKDISNTKQTIYIYLLLATRLNMKARRMVSDIDATHLFEKLSEQIARNYFGERSKSMLFSNRKGAPSFPERVNKLCENLQEGAGFRNPNTASPTAQDGKLDIAVWKPFTDGLSSKLIGFGQCKTGTSYKDSISQLQPDDFCKKWMMSQPSLNPVRMFFIAESLSTATWNETAIDAGLLFDRCRIIDYSDNISEDVFREIETWSRVATEKELISTVN